MKATAKYFLNLLGISNLKVKWSFSTKDIHIEEVAAPGMMITYNVPIFSIPIFSPPQTSKDGHGRLELVIHVVLPRFINKNGGVIPPEYISGKDADGNDIQKLVLPEKYTRGVVLTMLPNNYFRLVYESISKALEKMSPEDETEVLGFFEENLAKWETTKEIDLNKLSTMDAFNDFIFAIILHEQYHEEGLHVPDKFPKGKPEADVKRMSKYGVDAWKAIWKKMEEENPEFKSCFINCKNYIKTVAEAANIPQSVNKKAYIDNIRHLENQADRASMFKFEICKKIIAIKKMFGFSKEDETLPKKSFTDGEWKLKNVSFTDCVYDLEDAIKAGTLEKVLEENYLSLLQGMDAKTKEEKISKLKSAFQNAETTHPFIYYLKVPPIHPLEREFFRQLYNHLRHIKEKLGIFDEFHFTTSRFIAYSVANKGVATFGYLSKGVEKYLSLGQQLLVRSGEKVLKKPDTFFVPPELLIEEVKTQISEVGEKHENTPDSLSVLFGIGRDVVD